MGRPSRVKNFRRAQALAAAAAALLCASAPALPQQRPAPTPRRQQQQPPTTDEQDETISVNTNLVQVDAVVLDKRGRQVTDLRAADFEIVEDGQARQPEFCSYVTAAGEGGPSAAPTDGRLAASEVRRSIVFVVANPLIQVKNNVIDDDRPFDTVPSSVLLTQAVTDAGAAEKVLRRFVDQQMGAHDLAAIRESEGPSPPLGALTTDRALLRRAIGRVGESPLKKAPKVTVILGESRTMLLRPLVEQNLRVLQMMDDAVEQLSRLPGRRVVVLVSRGTLYALRALGVEAIVKRMDDVIAKANRARVTFYTLNPRGPGEANLRGGGLQDNSGLMTLARETGGRAIFNANDLTQGFSSILEENRGYYLLGYNPGAEAAARPHNIKVNVRRPDLRAQARATAYAPAATLRGPVGRPQLGEVLESPLALREVKLRLTPLYLSPDGRTARIMSLVNIDLRGAEWGTKPDGARTANLDVVGRVVAPDGRVLFQKGRGYALSVPPAEFERTLARGIDYWFDVGAEHPGLYQVSVAVRDAATGRAGNAVEFVEAADLARSELSVSSLLLSGGAEGSAAAAPPAPAREESFAAYSRREFAPGGTLRYQLYAYRAPRGPRAGAAGLQVQATIKRGGVVQAAMPARAVSEAGAPVFVGGDIALAGLPAGRYTLEVTITDRNSRAGRGAAVSSDFQITSRGR